MNHKYDSSIDMFSLGVLAHLLLVGYLPYRGKTDNDIAK